MEVIFYQSLALIPKLSKIWIYLFLGFLIGRFFHIPRKWIARSLIYVMGPFVFFLELIKKPIESSQLFLIPLIFLVCSTCCLLSYFRGKQLFTDYKAHLFAFAGGSANTGYFGIPACLLLFGPKHIPYLLLTIFGYNLYESTLGYFITAKSNRNGKAALLRVLKLPNPYVFTIGIFLNLNSFTLNAPKLFAFGDFVREFYCFVGIAFVGFVLAKTPFSKIDQRFTLNLMGVKILLWPLLILSFLILETHYFPFLQEASREVLILIASVPLASNGISIAEDLGINSSVIAISILVSFISSLFFIPLLLQLTKNLIL